MQYPSGNMLLTGRGATLYRVVTWITVLSTLLNLLIVPPTVAAQSAEPNAAPATPVVCAVPQGPFDHQLMLPLLRGSAAGNPVDLAPITQDCLVSLSQGSAVIFDLSKLAYDPNRDPLAFSLRSQPTQGTASLSGSQVTYRAAADFVGEQTIAYRVSDTAGKFADAQIKLTISAIDNDPPTANNRDLSVEIGGQVSVDLATLASDPNNDPLSFSLSDTPDHGTARIVGTTLTYTPTTTTPLTDTIVYRATDSRNASAEGTIRIRVTGAVNEPPLARDAVITIGVTETALLDLRTLASDPDGGSLRFEIAANPRFGSASLTGSVLQYIPNTSLTVSDTLIYRAIDGLGVASEATILIQVRPTQLHMTPGSALLTAPGQQRTLTVQGYDSVGRELDASSLDLIWTTDRPDLITLTPSADGTSATVTGNDTIGMALIVVRSRNRPEIPAVIASISTVQVAAGVRLVADDELIFPPTNPIPNRPISVIEDLKVGKPVAGFTAAEVMGMFDTINNIGFPDQTKPFRYAVIVRGAAPAVNSLIVASESAPVIGRVLKVIERNGVSLLQVQVLDLAQVFQAINFEFSSEKLIANNILTPQEVAGMMLAQDDGIMGLTSGGQMQALSLGNLLSWERFKDSLDCGDGPSLDLTMVSIKLNDLSSATNFLKITPIITGSYERVPGAWVEPESFHLAVGLKVTVAITSQLEVQPGAEFEFSCKLKNKKYFLITKGPGPLAILFTLFSPGISFAPGFSFSTKLITGPKFTLTTTSGVNLHYIRGVEWKRNTPGYPRSLSSEGFDPFLNTSTNYTESDVLGMAFKVEAKAGIYGFAALVIIFGGGFLDLLGPIADESIGRYIEDLGAKFVEFKVGPEVKLEWGSTKQVLNEKGGFVPALKVYFVAEGALNVWKLNKLLEELKIPKTIDAKLFERGVPLADLFPPLQPGTNKVDPGEIVNETDLVRFNISPVFSPTASLPASGGVYYKNTLINKLVPSGTRGDLTSDTPWQVSSELCADSKLKPDGIVELDVIGYNKLFGFLPTPYYLGTVKLNCSDLQLGLYPNPDPRDRQDSTIIGCLNKDGSGELVLSANASAVDRAKRLKKLTLKLYGPDKVVEGDGKDTERLDADLTYTFTPNDPTIHIWVAEITALDSKGQETRKKTVDIPFTIKWEDCGETVIEKETRTRSERCFTIVEERSRQGKRTVNPSTGESTIEWSPWGGWSEKSRRASGACNSWARGSGDPHILTPDGFEYDSFALGEFVYLQPRPGLEGGITVQARQERVTVGGGGVIFHPWTSWNTAFAFKLGDQVIQLEVGKLKRPLINGVRQDLAEGIYAFGEVDLKINSDREVTISYGEYLFIVNQTLNFLEIRSSIPQDGGHHGMLGTPDGDFSNDFALPDGTPASDAFDMANGWRITERSKSLFTYEAGKGPESYNATQLREPPSREQLEPFVAQATQLLESHCAPGTSRPRTINNIALELFTGRQAQEIASAGLCWYDVSGVVSNEFVPGLPVPGATITVRNGDTELCTTYTDRRGRYTCAIPSSGMVPTLAVSVSGRGATSASLLPEALPPADGQIPLRRDLVVAPTTAQINGLVRDRLGNGLYNAQIRLTGPANVGYNRNFATSAADGSFRSYLMFDDGAASGDVTYQVFFSPEWDTLPTAKGSQATFVRPLPALTANALTNVSETLELTGNIVVFQGRVAYNYDNRIAVPGVRVQIAPTTPIAGWNGCDITSRVFTRIVTDPNTQTSDESQTGTYRCEFPTERSAPFDVAIKVVGQDSVITRTVDLSGKGVGEVVSVLADLLIATTVVEVEGIVLDRSGAPVAGADVSASLDNSLNASIATVSGIDGRFRLVFGMRKGFTSGTLRYSVSYNLIKVSNTTPISNLIADQVNTREVGITVDGRYLLIEGRVNNTFAPESALSGNVTVSADGIGVLCTTSIGSANSFGCGTQINPGSQTALTLRFTATGPWGTATAQRQLTTLPPLGGQVNVVQEIQATATTLKLTGKVTGVTGSALPGANVQIAGSNFAVETLTDGQGQYTAFVALASNQTTGALTYTVSYRANQVQASGSFQATANQMTTVSKDLSYNFRQIVFSGSVRNSFGIEMPASTLTISAPALDRPCMAQTGVGGVFICAAQTNAEQPFEATFVASGVWGERTLTRTVYPSAGQATQEIPLDLVVDPTALHLTGKVTDPNGVGLAGVTVGVVGETVYREGRTTTDAQGNYSFYVVLEPGSSATISSMLNFRVGYGNALIFRNVPFTVARNSLGAVSYNFELAARAIQFEGKILNGTGGTAKVFGTRVQIFSPQLGSLCESAGLDIASKETYVCTAFVTSDQPFDVAYYLDGAWGTAEFTGTVTTLPTAGGRSVINREFTVKPTVLNLTGTVADRDGKPMRNATINVTSPQLDRPLETQTNDAGQYSLWTIVPSDTTNLTLNYLATSGNYPAQAASQTVTVVGGTLNSTSQDLRFTARRVVLKGTLRNLTDPSLGLSGQLQIVSPDLGRSICTVNISTSGYTCDALIETDAPFKLNYRVVGMWGSITTLNREVTGGANEFITDFEASPNVVYLSGAVRGSNGSNISNVGINIISGVAFSARAVSSSTGYRVAVVLPDGLTSGPLRYEASINNLAVVAQGEFALPANAKTIEVTKDLGFTSRIITFRGSLINSLTGGTGMWSSTRVVISSPTLGKLCETTTTRDFSCNATITTDQPFEVQFSANGDWGSTTSSATVSSLPEAGQIGVFNRDISAMPTMLIIRGSARTGDGDPISGVQIETTGPEVASVWQRGTSDGNGNYVTAVLLKRIDGTQSGNITVAANYRGARQTQMVAYTATAGQITTVEASALSFVFLARTVTVKGTLINTVAPNEPLAKPVANIAFKSVTGGDYCQAVRGSEFTCTVTLYTADPLEMTIQVFEAWGQTEKFIRVDNVPPPSGTLQVTTSIEVAPTTLRLNGVISDGAGKPFANAEVQITLPAKTLSGMNRVTARTTATGEYLIYALLATPLPASRFTYDIEVDQIPSSFIVPSPAAPLAQLTSVRNDFSIEQRRVRFSGKLINTNAPSVPMSGRVVITSPDRFTTRYCEATVDTNGRYSCDAYVRSAENFEVNYRAFGDWGESNQSGSVTGVTGPGGSVLISKDLSASPTTLRVSGQMTDRFGKPLAGTVIRLSGANTIGTPSYTVGSNGFYTMTVLLRSGMTAGELTFNSTYFSVSRSETRSFQALNLGQLNDRVFDLEINSRKITFNGRVRLTPNVDIPMSGKLTITGPQNSLLCETNLNSTGGYNCTAQAAPIDAFTANFKVEGDWGVASSDKLIDFGAAGSTSEVTHLFDVTPTTLLISGKATGLNGTPLVGVNINFLSTDLSSVNGVATATTDANGDYRRYLVLKNGVLDGALTLNISYNTIKGSTTVPFVARINQITEVNAPLDLTARTVAFSGNVRNRLDNNRGLGNTQITIAVPGMGTICSDNTDANGAYTCEVQVYNASSFAVVYNVSGTWGSTTVNGSVPTGAVGGRVEVAQNLDASPTTLVLSGRLINGETNAPMGGAAMSIAAGTAVDTVNATTDANGYYTTTMLLRAGETLAELDYTVTVNSTAIRGKVTQRVALNTKTAISRDFVFAVRTLQFRPSLYLAPFPSYAFNTRPDVTFIVASPNFGELCRFSPYYYGTNSCSAQVSATEPFSVSYTVTGNDWGTSVITGSTGALPAIGGSSQINQVLPINPTMLVITGTVKTSAGTPLKDVTVTFSGSSAIFSSLMSSYSAKTDATGVYTVPLIFKTGATSARLTYRATLGGGELVGAEREYPLIANQLSRASQAITFEQRQITFSGNILNSLNGQKLYATTITVKHNGGPTLCTWSLSGYYGAAGTYSCQAQWNGTNPLTPTFALSGDWGSAVVTGTAITAFPPLGTAVNATNHLSVSPTTLRLRGRVFNADNQGVSGATVRMEGTGLSSQNLTLQATASTTGSYVLDLVLKSGVTTATVAYNVTAGGVVVRETAEYAVNANQLTSVSRNFTVAQRRFNFTGYVQNTLGNNDNLRFTAVTVKHNGSPVCAWTVPAYSSYSNYYTCSADLQLTGAVTFTYDITGYNWGSAVVTQSLTLPAGSPVNVGRNLPVSPATVRLSGIVTKPDTSRLQYTSVNVSSAAFAYDPNGSNTNAQGEYNIYAVLNTNATTGTLSYRTIYSSGEQNFSGVFTKEGQLTTVNRNIAFTARQIYVSGTIQNILNNNATLLGTVTISSTAFASPCVVTTSYSYSSYACTRQVFTNASVPVTIRAEGTWGSAETTVTAAAGDVGSSTWVNQNLLASPTTLRLSGLVTVEGANPPAGSQLTISSPALSDPITVWLASDGGYNTTILVRPGITSGVITYSMQYNNARVTRTANFTVPANTLGTVEKDILINDRSLYVGGSVKHANLNNTEIGITRVQVALIGSGEETLCTTQYNRHYTWYDCNGSSSLSGQVNMRFTVSGDWGSETFIDTTPITMPAVGGWMSVSRNITVNPALVQFTGVVSDDLNQAVGFASISAAGPNLSESLEASGSSDANGNYSFYGVLKAGAGTSVITHNVDYRYADQDIAVTFTPAASGVTVVNRNLTVTQRMVYFYGSLYNAFNNYSEVPSTEVVVRLLGGGELCRETRETGMNYFGCDGLITSGQPITPVFTVSGTWGSEIITGTAITNLPPVGEQLGYNVDLLLHPTTLRLTGNVTRDGQPQPWVGLEIASAGFVSGNIYVDSGENGTYEAFIPLKAGVTSGTLNYTIYTATGEMPFSANFSGMRAKQATTVTQNIVINP